MVTRIATGEFHRLRLTPQEVAQRRSERWENASDETWLPAWTPLPAGIHRGPYAPPTRTNLERTLAGLERLRAAIQREEATDEGAETWTETWTET
ncbi:hypothetical protein ACIOJD_26385 [Streptomyces sp. NPDC088116]|uniref:hypothetical protein n=1 Tax=Streptomyces sp. NPDC088116 TaxID=3365825 RepID=UPI0038089AFA